MHVALHDAGALAALRARLAARLGAQAVPPEAHLSLCYVDNSEPEERTRVAARLRAEGRIVAGPEGAGGRGGVLLNCAERPAEAGAHDLVGGFDGGEIWVVSCDGPVPGWEVRDRIQLPL